MNRRPLLLFALIALIGAFLMTRWIAAPGYTDVYYHFNAATRFASGQGLTDAYVWTYIGATDSLPMPSHLYWMPLTSLIAGLSMKLFNAPGDYAAAQLPFALMLAATACVGFWLGGHIGRTRRHAWVAGLLTLFSGFYAKFWGEIDTFAPYALVGSLCLVFIGLGAQNIVLSRRAVAMWFIAGMFAALGHLTRADGLLLFIVGVLVIVGLGVRSRTALQGIVVSLIALTFGYLLVMLPYFARNLNEIGTPLPLGGTQAIWFDEYNDLFNYPPDSTPATLFVDGLNSFISSRREALVNNFGTFIAVEGWVIVTPLMLIGLWRRSSFLFPFALYALGLHLAMTFVFPFPGYRGGLLHSAAALIPFWAALGVAGLDDIVDWIARRRRRWNAHNAKMVFSGGLVAIAITLSLYIGMNGRVIPQNPAIYTELRASLPANARILSDDPTELYYYTGMGGATLPNEPPGVLLDVALRYDIDYVLIKNDAAGVPAPLLPMLDNPPTFLTPLPFNSARLYAIQR